MSSLGNEHQNFEDLDGSDPIHTGNLVVVIEEISTGGINVSHRGVEITVEMTPEEAMYVSIISRCSYMFTNTVNSLQRDSELKKYILMALKL